MSDLERLLACGEHCSVYSMFVIVCLLFVFFVIFIICCSSLAWPAGRIQTFSSGRAPANLDAAALNNNESKARAASEAHTQMYIMFTNHFEEPRLLKHLVRRR